MKGKILFNKMFYKTSDQHVGEIGFLKKINGRSKVKFSLFRYCINFKLKKEFNFDLLSWKIYDKKSTKHRCIFGIRYQNQQAIANPELFVHAFGIIIFNRIITIYNKTYPMDTSENAINMFKSDYEHN